MTTQTLLTPTSYTSQSSSRTKLVKPSASPVPVGYTDSKGTLHHTKLGAKLGTRRERREREDELSKPGNVRGGRRDVELEGIEHDLEHTQFRGATPNLPRRNSKRTTSDSESVASSASSSSSGERFPAVMNHRKNSYTSTLGNGSGSFNSAPRRGSPKSIRDRQAEREEKERLREQRQRERLERMSGRHYGGSGYESKNRVASDNAPPLSRYASGMSTSSTTFGGGRGRLASETMKSPLLSGGGGGFQGGLLRAASISSSSYTPQLVVPVAPRTVGKDLRFEKLVPTAPSYRPKNVTDTSAGDRLWGNTKSDARNDLLRVDPNRGNSVKSSLMEATIRKEKRQSILNPNAQRKTSISTGDGDNPSLPSTSSTSPSKLDKRSVYASLGVGSVSSVPSRMHVGSRIDDSDVERAQRASMDLSRLEETAKDGGRWRSRSSAMAIGAYRGDDGLLSRAPLEEEEYDRRDFNNDTAGGYDVGRDDDSDDSLPPPVLESNFLGKKGETAVSTPSKQSVDLYGIPEEGHDFDPSGGEKGHSQSTRGGGKKPKTKRKKSTDPAGMIRSATENNELRGTGSLSEGFKDMNYGLRRSLDSFKVGAKFEVFRAKKKIGRALLG